MCLKVIKNIFYVFFMFSVLAFCKTLPCQAALKQMPLEELVSQSDTILVGTIANLQSSWNKGETIITEASINPETFLKHPQVKKEIIVRVFGGEVGEIGLAVSTEPVLKKGERALLFLKKAGDKDNVYRPVNGHQGKYTLGQKDIILENNLSLDEFIAQIKNITDK